MTLTFNELLLIMHTLLIYNTKEIKRTRKIKGPLFQEHIIRLFMDQSFTTHREDRREFFSKEVLSTSSTKWESWMSMAVWGGEFEGESVTRCCM